MIKLKFLSFRILLCFAILGGCAAAPAYGQDGIPPETRKQIDSLENLIRSATGEEKLDLYREILNSYFYSDLLAETTAFLDRYIAEATVQGNEKHKGVSISSRATYYVNLGHLDSLLVYAPEALKKLKNAEDLRPYFHVLVEVIDAHLIMGSYDAAMKELKTMYEDAVATGDDLHIGNALYQMGRAYTMQIKLDDAVTTMREAVEVLSRTDPKNYGTLILACIELSNALRNVDLYEEALQACKRGEKAILDYEESLRNRKVHKNTGITWFNLNMEYLGAHSDLGNHKEGEEYLRKLEESPLYNQSQRIKLMVIKKKAKLYESMGRNDEAYDLYKYHYREQMDNDIRHGMSALSFAAALAYDIGRYKESAEDFSELMGLKDSLNSQESMQMLNDLRTQYEVEKLEMQKARQRMVIMLAGMGCILLAIIAIIYILYSRRLRRKNLSLYRQIQERTACEYNVEMAVRQIPEQELTREQKLFRDLSNLMDAEKLFTTPNLDRNALAERLGTNRQYLADAVKQGSGRTLGAYMADLRLKYALELLTNNKELTLEAIAEETGHASYSPFFKAFIQKYGMSPSEYRKLSMAKTGANKEESESQHPDKS